MIWRRLFTARPWADTLYLLLDLPLGIAWFTLMTTGLSVGAGLIPLMLIGIPIFGATLVAMRWISAVERARCKALLNTEIASPFGPLPRTRTWKPWATAVFADGANWRGILYCSVMLPVGIATFTIAITLWTVAITLALWPLYAWIPTVHDNSFSDWKPDATVYTALVIAGAVVGWLLLAACPYVMRGLARVDIALVRNLLGRSSRRALEQEVTALEQSRVASVDAASSERARIERDLHDGVQPRLVAAAMELGIARERLAAGQPAGRVDELLVRAHDETKAAITELRELVRGMHPAILVDRGLEPALSALVARFPFPVELDVRLATRLASQIEATAYFVVAEALTNVSKHSGAARARVAISRSGDKVLIEVFDDGRGGARIGGVGGLAGMSDRVAAVRGQLRIASPDGGPTILSAELPCA